MKDGAFGLRFAAAVTLLALAPTLAWSYIDPGNGAYMVQTLFTLIGAALFYVRHPVRSLRALWDWLSSGRQADQRPSDSVGPSGTQTARAADPRSPRAD
jgi:hypothetical protein